jgi:hypothetical protein
MMSKFNRSAIWLFGLTPEFVMSPAFPPGILACLEVYFPGHLVAIGLRNRVPQRGSTIVFPDRREVTDDNDDVDFVIALLNRKCADALAAEIVVYLGIDTGLSQDSVKPTQDEAILTPAEAEDLPGLVEDDEDVELGRPARPPSPVPPRIREPFIYDEELVGEMDFDIDEDVFNWPWEGAGAQALRFGRMMRNAIVIAGGTIAAAGARVKGLLYRANFEMPDAPRNTPGLTNSGIKPFVIYEWAARRDSLKHFFFMIVFMVLWFSFGVNGSIVGLISVYSEAVSQRVEQLLMFAHAVMMTRMTYVLMRRILSVMIVWKPHHQVEPDEAYIRFATMKRVDLEYTDTLYEYRRCYRFHFFGVHDYHNVVSLFYDRPSRLVASIDRIAHGFDGRAGDSHSTTVRAITVQRTAGSDSFEADPSSYARHGIFMNTNTLTLMHWSWIKAGQPDTLN